MSDLLLLMFKGPAIVREVNGPAVLALLIASYIRGLGDTTPITTWDEISRNPRPLEITITSTEI